MELTRSEGCVPEQRLSGSRIITPTIEERLIQRKVDLEQNLKEVNDALQALQKNPEVLNILCLISKVNY